MFSARFTLPFHNVAACMLSLALLAGCTPSAATTPPEYSPLPQTDAAKTAAVARSLPAFAGEPGVAVGTRGAVASAEGNASRVGVEVLKKGGNAVDAAIAVAFALAVTHPTAGNLGGGGFMMVRLADGTSAALDYRETAPAGASRNMYLDAAGNMTRESLLGAKAAGIPGTVAGLALAHERFATRPWAELIAPAIALARDGHALEASHAESMAEALAKMREAGFTESVRIYADQAGQPLAAGAIWKQPDLARTLELIAQQGAKAFYEGALAETMAKGVKSLGGLWTVEDLRGYRAKERAPIKFVYRAHEIITMPPPSSGGVVMRQILGASELLDFKAEPFRSVTGLHLYVEAARRAFADRADLMGDPDFVRMDTERLISMEYVKRRMSDIDRSKPTPSESIAGGTLPDESAQTTHFSVVDGAGNAVANTYTLNTGFGSKAVIPGTGILLNNEMDDFASKPGSPNAYGLIQSEQNAIAPGKRMLSSMTPTIVVKDGALRAVVGTPGGPTIINTVTQIVRALVDYGLPIDQAVRAPRLHHQWKPDRIMVEDAFEPEIEKGLQALGHATMHRGTFGHADCIEVDPATHGFRAAADVARGGGEAVAY
jgi:gamma-glutamyltranspeptidase / glutathione hydrolase